MSELKQKEKLKLISNFLVEKKLFDRVQAIKKSTKANHTDVLRNLVERGADSYESDNDKG